jgi:hypothetical protein
MATRNDVTGDELKSRGNSDAFKDGYDRIWGSKKKVERDEFDEPNAEDYPENDCGGAQHGG